MNVYHQISRKDCLSHQLWPHFKKGWPESDKPVHFFWGLGDNQTEKIVEVLEGYQTGEVYFAQSAEEKDGLWRLRKNVSPAVNSYTLTKAEDVVVPRGNLPKLITAIKEIGKEYGFNSVCFGHAGDGNLHINVMKEQISDDRWNKEVNEGIADIFKAVVDLGGTLSGEHGIGIAKRPYMHLAVGEKNLDLMRGIKSVFDPNGILNPEKIF